MCIRDRYTARLANGQELTITRDVHDPMMEVGEKISLGFNRQVVNVFDAGSEESVMKDVSAL